MKTRKRVFTKPCFKTMRIILFGAGAMSCLFAARLSQVAQVVLVDTWVEAISAIRERGILIENSGERRSVAVEARCLGMPLEPADLIIVLVKSWQTAEIASYVPGYLKPEGLGISLQNGLGNLEILGPRVFPGSTSEGATLIGPGRIRAGGSGPTHIVAPDWVVALFHGAGFECYGCDENEARGLLWGKLSVSCGINALTALLRIPNGELLTNQNARDLMIRATMECAAVANAAGIELPFADPARKVAEVAERTAGNKSSMLQDILRGAPTECDAINGAVVREGKRLGIATPVNEILLQLVQAAVHVNRSQLQ
jgi:2-dehydropantoate 2-reductase